MARPIPRLPPVMTAFFPLSPKSMYHLLSSLCACVQSGAGGVNLDGLLRQVLTGPILVIKEDSMVYLQASIKLRAGKLSDFTSLLNTLTPVVGRHGWKLLGSYASVVGRLNTVVDFWELPDATALQAALSDPEMARY